MNRSELIDAVLIGEAEIPEEPATKFKVGEAWRWEDPKGMPEGKAPWSLPGGADAGVFYISRISCSWPKWGVGYHGSLQLMIGISTYLQSVLDAFPVTVTGRFPVPAQQMMMVQVWGLMGSDIDTVYMPSEKERSDDNLFRVELHGKWERGIR